MTTPRQWIERAQEALDGLALDELIDAGVLLPDDRFFPTITYPPITMYPAADPDTLFDGEPLPPEIPNAAYVHVPFCAFSCAYCHWVKTIGAGTEQIDEYLDLLEVEMGLAVGRLGVERLPVSTVLFGGGTPTYPSLDRLERLLDIFEAHFDLSSCRQFSFEAEPASLLGDEGLAKLRLLRERGVDRISIGVQSFLDPVLQRMGRHHSGDQALRAIEQIRRAGIDSISIDLIYGYPGQSEEDWIRTMQLAIDSGVDAWHLYRLRVKRHGDVEGAIHKQFRKTREQFPDRSTIHRMKMVGWLMSLDHGYGQYFTRIFCSGQQHVTQFMWDYCCNLTNVVGTGPSAWGNYHRTFTLNAGADREMYRSRVLAGKLPMDRGVIRDLDHEARRSLILPLKNDRVYRRRFTARTGLDLDQTFGPELDRLRDLGLLDSDERSVYLTDRGRFVADETMMQLYHRRYLPFPEVAHDRMPD
jgi:oxygen-independent coproporphyrinogen III oxidase